MKTNSNWFYMHTIGGYPAQYYPGEQICYANGTRGGSGVSRLAQSIAQIKKEQRLSSKWRKSQGFDAHMSDYGYVRVAKKLLK